MNNLPRILYVEDDETLAFITIDNLKRKGFEVIHSANGLDAYELFMGESFDICLFDVMLPKMDGFDLAYKVRSVNKEIPMLFITAKTLPEDRIKGLLLGADDYIVKPYSIEELILRINVFLKRRNIVEFNNDHNLVLTNNVTFDFEKLQLKTPDEIYNLTYREAELLKFFIENKNTILPRERILNALWGSNDYFLGRSLDVFITRLRKYFKNVSGITIENKHGVGFVFKVE
mgnify:CR=1 FL=1